MGGITIGINQAKELLENAKEKAGLLIGDPSKVDAGLIPGLGKFGEGTDNSIQYSCLENPRTEESDDGVAKSQT